MLKHIAPSCDTMVALGGSCANGATLFAKNSDRPARECQPLFQAPRRRHQAGERLQCQYIEIPQVEETCGLIGSRPAWLWGLEHGVNDRGVAIGNEALITKDALPATGLLGMDLVRLGLERGRTAREALEVIGELIERYGQGGSSARDFDWRYSNGFIIADHAEAWTLETSGHQWAARHVEKCASISNRISTASYDRASASVRDSARERGWWDGRSPFDFGASYADETHPTSFSARARLARTGELLARSGKRAAPEMCSFLRDHYERGEMPVIDAPPESERHFSVCMHTDFICTTASIVAELPAPGSGRMPIVWASMGAPCTSIFFALFLDGTIPDALTAGTIEPSPDSIWWRMKAIQDTVAQAPDRLAPVVWRRFRPLEDRMFDVAGRLASNPRESADANALTALMAGNLAQIIAATAQVERELRDELHRR